MSPRVTVVGLGPAGPGLITVATMDAIARYPRAIVRTVRHPSAAALADAASCDDLYESGSTIEEVYDAIVQRVVDAAGEAGAVLYAVPGSPAVAERTVELLRAVAADGSIDLDVLPALSCVDLAWARLGIDPLAARPRIVDGHTFSVDAAGGDGPLLVLQCDRPTVLADIKLSADDGPDVTVMFHLGLDDERILTVAWNDLDRIDPDHLTSLWIPGGLVVAGELVRFAELVTTLRGACPWDKEQTHASLRPFVIEEAYEVVDAIDGGDPDELEEELGDLLFQVFFHATLAAEQGAFTLADVARGIHDKLVRRHPHVFGGPQLGWDELKRQEHPDRTGTFDGVPNSLPALAFADALQRRAAKVGFDWPDVDGAWPKVTEEIAELKAAGPGLARVGDGRLAVCVRQRRPPSEDRSRGGVAVGFVKVPRPVHRSGAAGTRARHRSRPGRSRRAVGRSQTLRDRWRLSAANRLSHAFPTSRIQDTAPSIAVGCNS
jgi:tetrapyrrole methylase family protein/MazG family protein